MNKNKIKQNKILKKCIVENLEKVHDNSQHVCFPNINKKPHVNELDFQFKILNVKCAWKQ